MTLFEPMSMPGRGSEAGVSRITRGSISGRLTSCARLLFYAVLSVGILLPLVLTLTMSLSVDSVWQNLRARYLGLESLSGSFSEVMCSEVYGTCTSFSGVFALRLPNDYRIDVTSTPNQLIVGNDSVLWFYFPEEERAIRQVGSQTVPLTVFLEPMMDSGTSVTLSEDGADNLVLAVSMSDSLMSFYDLELELDSTRSEVRAFSFVDAWGSKYHFVLSDQEWNPKLSEDAFEFVPPPGTTVE